MNPRSKEAGGSRYNDALFDGDIVCVTRKEKVNGTEWAYISNKLDGPNVRTPVGGWSDLKYLQALSADAARTALAGTAPPAGKRPATAATTAPPAAPAAQGAAAAMRPEDILRFDQPIPFGPYPVNGHSLKEMIDSTLQFPPIKGLDESLWKKKCTSCHQWNQARLCEQGKTYVKSAKMVLRVPHPFGGAFKLAIMRWTKSGCE